MKYIITESRLDNIIFNYLDMKLNGIEKRTGKYMDILFALPDEEYAVIGWKKSGHLYVYYKIKEDIQNLFGLESSDALDVIGRYIEDRFNLKVKDTLQDGRVSFYLVENR
jgi:hypothetical protein